MEKKAHLRDGTEILIRELREDDVERSFEFFGALPKKDRLYLRNDVTKREVIEERIQKMKACKCIRLVAVNGEGRIVADGSLESESYTWRDHVAELRLIVASDFQRKSLGMLLARELYLVAASKGVEEIVAQFMAPQKAAFKIIERLGFTREAVLPGHVKDIAGHRHDLIIMRCKLQEVLDELENYVARYDWQRTR
ncbi:MAG: GNAT family protein [Candidatus Krumholzibacteriota bacterium]